MGKLQTTQCIQEIPAAFSVKFQLLLGRSKLALLVWWSLEGGNTAIATTMKIVHTAAQSVGATFEQNLNVMV